MVSLRNKKNYHQILPLILISVSLNQAIPFIGQLTIRVFSFDVSVF